MNVDQALGRFAACWRILSAAVLICGPLTSHAQQIGDLTRYSDFGQPDILLTAASIRQSGDHHIGVIDQRTDISSTDRTLNPIGDGNIADLVQDGSYNEAYLSQTGNLNRIRVEQSGSYNRTEITQDGVANTVDLKQDGFNNQATLTQIGTANTLDLQQTGANNYLISIQNGDSNSISFSQVGGNSAVLNQYGDHNTIIWKQELGETKVRSIDQGTPGNPVSGSRLVIGN